MLAYNSKHAVPNIATVKIYSAINIYYVNGKLI